MRKILKYLDKPLLIVTTILFIFGLIMVFSSSNVVAYMSHEVSASHYFIKQAEFLLIGLVIALVITIVPTRWYRPISTFLLVLFSIGLVLLLFIVDPKKGARSWFDLGPISIQPSEFIKVIIIAWLAMFYESHQKKLSSYVTSLVPIVISMIIAGLIFLQPDLGTTIIFAFIVAAIFFSVPIAKEIKGKIGFIALGLIVLAVIALVLTGGNILTPAQKERLNFLRPCDRLLSSGDQVCNCYIAINNGGLTGTGLGNSTQKYLYLAEPYTDFIFAIIVEELGIITGIILILAYIFVIYRILLIGRQSPTNRGATMCYGIAIYIFIHIAINLLGIFGLMPMTGVPLPFMSYGGSFTICLVASLAIVQRINIENKLFKEGLRENA